MAGMLNENDEDSQNGDKDSLDSEGSKINIEVENDAMIKDRILKTNASKCFTNCSNLNIFKFFNF
jgi:hypothetical protein